MAELELAGIIKNFGTNNIIHEMDLKVASGEFLVIVGPSGCGKSTLLRMIAGLEPVSAGVVSIGNRVVNKLSPKERGIAMVFQNYALYPHMTVQENIAFGLKLAKLPDDEVERRVTEAAKVLRLNELMQRKPHQLSGGQKQRVAMGRAMVRRPAIFLFDEPLSNLDAQLRVQMRAEISGLHRRLKSTVVYVTHDQVEAMTLADRIVVMNGGKIEQVAAPMELYLRPATRFVASFIGSPAMNFLPVSAFPAGTGLYRAETIGFRAEDTLFVPADKVEEPGIAAGSEGKRNRAGAEYIIAGTGAVKLVEPLGPVTHVHCEIAPGLEIVSEYHGSMMPMPGDKGFLKIAISRMHFFDGNGLRIHSSAAD